MKLNTCLFGSWEGGCNWSSQRLGNVSVEWSELLATKWVLKALGFKGVGVQVVFNMKKSLLVLPNYMKLKIKLLILSYLYQL